MVYEHIKRSNVLTLVDVTNEPIVKSVEQLGSFVISACDISTLNRILINVFLWIRGQFDIEKKIIAVKFISHGLQFQLKSDKSVRDTS